MKIYSAFMQRVVATAGPQANFSITVQAVTSNMAKIRRSPVPWLQMH
ncbi:hypothetical protein BV330_05217 [Pseudomonas syringae pv. actinidiae]|nr:hypothetical protein BV339_05194 [Pseudomonas syringae pv. actinidiae]OSN44987.1 hypothetical protein BV345_05104 [Pseudomonas syringae pv. actinidiae]OSN46783.1 hypothetical protein BV346_05107 [Pseudomonas syringae pv. actinidiae]OSR82311.1 hypothetical protein BV329_05143 [Pseudomonas syringae pv. actinidiae]OSR83321.1 hypothetical protein BV330_05217 [Pseudomonas syringae pv. actinidiae]